MFFIISHGYLGSVMLSVSDNTQLTERGCGALIIIFGFFICSGSPAELKELLNTNHYYIITRLCESLFAQVQNALMSAMWTRWWLHTPHKPAH